MKRLWILTVVAALAGLAVRPGLRGAQVRPSGDAVAEPAATLWYRQPASQWDHALPVGNGRLGAMVFGGANRERIQLNDESLWMGSVRERDNPDALAHLPEVRRLLFAGWPNAS
jgi:hypothetical protein